MSNEAITRVVVTGSIEGASSVLSEETVQGLRPVPGMPTVSFQDLWVTAQAPIGLSAPPGDAHDEAVQSGRGGHSVRLLEFQPDPPGYDARSGWHSTPTLDHVIVLSGAITCILDDGEVLLQVGDLLVQQGVPHAWSNRGSVPCQVVAVLMDAVKP